MKKRLIFLTTCGVLQLWLHQALATSIAINFGAEQGPGGSNVTGPAGVLSTSTWNNLVGANGAQSALIDGVGNTTGVSVTWAATTTWATTGLGEENNTAPPGNDRNLMTGYLDPAVNPATVSLSGLATALPGTYDVYVYITGGVSGRGGEYEIGSDLQTHHTTAPFDGTFSEGSTGNYLNFSDVAGDAFTLSVTPTDFRAPINGIELVSRAAPVPEPGLGVSLACLLSGVLMVRRRRTQVS